MGRKDMLVQACIDYCNDDSHGYQEANGCLPDTDCSSMMYNRWKNQYVTNEAQQEQKLLDQLKEERNGMHI